MLSADTQTQLDATDKMVDLVLRIMTSSSGPPETIELETGPTTARHRLLDVLSLALQAVERQLTADNEMHVEVDPPQPAALLAIILRLLKFALGLGRSEANMLTAPRADFGKLALTFAKVIQALPDGVRVGDLEDMLAFIVDCGYSSLIPAVSFSWLQVLHLPPARACSRRSSPNYPLCSRLSRLIRV